jgi:hypothetical protein
MVSPPSLANLDTQREERTPFVCHYPGGPHAPVAEAFLERAGSLLVLRLDAAHVTSASIARRQSPLSHREFNL